VVLSVLTFPSWDFATTAETGDITMPFPGEASDGGHAICLVGYVVDVSAPGGGRLMFRNSWGTTWAKKSQAAAGYGTLPFEYVKKYALEAFA
jgi:C1A family cysteine protease